MQRIKNQVLAPLQEAQKPIVYDAYFKNDGKAKAVVIFCHGYKGSKIGVLGIWLPPPLQRQGSFF
tara:strand:- start:17 stop:211 length:195 start_codon:yes stop_codon:yes gene_type:complete